MSQKILREATHASRCFICDKCGIESPVQLGYEPPHEWLSVRPSGSIDDLHICDLCAEPILAFLPPFEVEEDEL